ncbi:LamG-like jellyroll fold domain-containing protein [Rubrimonas cliftonensis]|uniref:Right handed beta helix region n=1 Tax=Rubrimonas cliftonensis TaxID=89524 RepID=A0A1H4CTN2_9RHOB|nr:LamG-like jellyroll fold domain-containing protein [Rubrimonas cliftonensis]SEA63679.1 Right handed beta helix region [Rubrimonas cliftonensis]
MSTQRNTSATVSSAAELEAALSIADGGTILLAPGNYGALRLLSWQQEYVRYDSEVVIRSADPDNPAVFTGFDLRGVENLAFESVAFEYDAPRGDRVVEQPFKATSVTGLRLTDVDFKGDLAEGVSSGADGYATGFGLAVVSSRDVTLEDSHIETFFKGATFNGVDGLTVRGNTIVDMRSDGLNFVDVEDALIADNFIGDFRAAPLLNDHRDAIQFWTAGFEDPSRNVTISGNYIDIDDGDWMQSIFIGNDGVGSDPTFLMENFEIVDNVIYNSHANAVHVDGVDGLVIARNTVLHNVIPGFEGGTYDPRIVVTSRSRDVLVERNVAPKIDMNARAGDNIVRDNLIVQRDYLREPHHYENLFVNAMADADATLEDLRAFPGGVIETLDVGSALNRFDTTPTAPDGFIVSTRGEALERSTYTLDARNVFDPDGRIAPERLQVTWRFGDGSTAQGLVVEHPYANAGVYDVTAEARIDGGSETLTLRKRLAVETPLIAKLDFENGLVDESDLAGSVTRTGAVSVTSEGDGRVLKMSGGYISLESADAFTNNDAFSLLIDFKKQAAADSGRLVALVGSFVIDIQEDGVRVNLTTSEGQWRFGTSSAAIRDVEWHSLGLTFSGESGVAKLYIDGVEISRFSGLDGHFQDGSSGQALHLGNPWGGGDFRGMVDNVLFYNAELSAEQVVLGGRFGDEIDVSNPIEPNLRPLLITFDEPRPTEGYLVRGAEIVDRDGDAWARFDGVDDMVTVAVAPEAFDDASQISVGATFEREDLLNGRLFSSSKQFSVDFRGPDVIVFVALEDGGAFRTIVEGLDIGVGEVHALQLDIDLAGDRIVLLHNDEIVLDEQAPVDFPNFGWEGLTVGGSGWVRNFNGYIDDFFLLSDAPTWE